MSPVTVVSMSSSFLRPRKEYFPKTRKERRPGVFGPSLTSPVAVVTSSTDADDLHRPNEVPSDLYKVSLRVFVQTPASQFHKP